MSITLQVSKNGDWEKLAYIGPINEDTEVHLTPLLQSLGPKVIINFKQVSQVNSCGVRAWINFMRDVEKNRELQFEECTPEIVSQMNMIPNFKGKAKVQSVYASYSCGSCGHEAEHLFVKGKNLPNSIDQGLEAVNCPKCNTAMEMEELEDEYFAWLDAG